MTKKIIILTLFFLVGMFACDICTERKVYFSIVDMKILNQEYEGQSHSVTTKDLVWSSAEVRKYAMLLDMEIEYTASTKSGNFGTAVYADECRQGEKGLKPSERLVSIRVLTETDYSPALPAGSDITEWVEYYTEFSGFGWQDLPVTPNQQIDLYEYSPLLLRLNLADPTNNVPQRFTVILTFKNGTIRTLESPSVYLF